MNTFLDYLNLPTWVPSFVERTVHVPRFRIPCLPCNSNFLPWSNIFRKPMALLLPQTPLGFRRLPPLPFNLNPHTLFFLHLNLAEGLPRSCLFLHTVAFSTFLYSRGAGEPFPTTSFPTSFAYLLPFHIISSLLILSTELLHKIAPICIYRPKVPFILDTIFLLLSNQSSTVIKPSFLHYWGTQLILNSFIRTLLAEDGNRSSELPARRRLSEPDVKSCEAAELHIKILSRLLGDLPPSVTRKCDIYHIPAR